MTEFIHVHEGITVTYRVPADQTVTEMAEHFRHFMLALGYSPVNVDQLFGIED